MCRNYLILTHPLKFYFKRPIMKRQIFHSLTAIFTGLILPCSAIAQTPEPLPADYNYSQVATYFTQSLEGQIDGMYSPAGNFKSNYVIEPDEIAAITAKVWEEWSKANSQFVSDGHEPTLRAKIPKLTTSGAKFQYDIPVSLEPYAYEYADPKKYTDINDNIITDHTMMQYVFGYKQQTSEPQPLLIYMHGSGEAKQEWSTVTKLAYMAEIFPSVYIVPRIPNGVGDYYRWYQKSKQWVWEKMIRQAMLRSDIDHDRIYFLGISEGAYGSQRLGSFYADYLGGVGPMAGGEPLPNAPCENLRNTYFNICTGSYDTAYGRNTLSTYVGEYLDQLQADDPEGYAHDVRIIAGADHGLNGGAYYGTMPPALKEHSRIVNPKRVRWENFPMDGRYRSGFHNLRVIERSESSAHDEVRTYYTMDIENNHIDVNVSLVTTEGTEWLSNIPLRIQKTYTPATKGRFKIYLNNELVDLNREVVVTVNGEQMFRGVLQPNLTDMVNSCADFYDPARVFPASVEIDLAAGSGSGITTGCVGLIGDDACHTSTKYYNLQGMRIDSPTAPGLYLKVQGGTTKKIIVR